MRVDSVLACASGGLDLGFMLDKSSKGLLYSSERADSALYGDNICCRNYNDADAPLVSCQLTKDAAQGIHKDAGSRFVQTPVWLRWLHWCWLDWYVPCLAQGGLL